MLFDKNHKSHLLSARSRSRSVVNISVIEEGQRSERSKGIMGKDARMENREVVKVKE